MAATPNIVPELSELSKPYTLPASDPYRLQTQMGSGVPGVDTQKIDVKALGKVGSQDRLQNIRQQEADLRQQESQAKQRVAEGQQKIAEFKTEGQSDITSQEAGRARGIYQSVEDYREKNPAPELTPTKENIQSLSTLFGLIGVIGMAMGGAGKMSATASLNAMGGMMKGWQQGRSDLWKKEVQEFDKSMLSWKAKLDDAIKKAEAAYKILPYNRAEAESKLNEVLTSMGSNLLKEQNRVQGFEPTFKNLESLAKDAEFAIKESGVERRHREDLASREELRKATLLAAQGRRDIKSMEAIGPALRNIAENYPDGTANQLVGASPDDKRRVQGSYRAIEESEQAADFIAKNKGAVGALAVAKNFLRIDAINSIKNDDEAAARIAKEAAIDQQIDEGVKKGQISTQDAQNAKILQKKLFGLALADVQSSGQRGSVYLDKQFQNLYDQASRQDTLLKIIKERAEENNRNLKPYKLNIERHNNPELFPLAESKDVDAYIKERAPAQVQIPQPVQDALKGKPDGTGARSGGKTYRIYGGEVRETQE
jgi:hypothetical protein